MTKHAVRVLVLDRDPATGETLRQALGKRGYRIETAQTLMAAQEMLEERQVHILILDLNLVEMDGLELLRKLRQQDHDLAVIVLTDSPSVESAVAALKAEVSDYLKKPVDRERFLEAVERIVRDKGLMRDPEEDLLATVGGRLRAHRQSQELTLKQVARRTGLSVSLLSQIERAESAASVASLFKIASALNSSLECLFEGF